MKIKYIGKSILIEKEGERILVIGDLHIGYEEAGNFSSGIINNSIYIQIKKDLEGILKKVKKKSEKINKIILLGDIKHGFSDMEKSERFEIINFLDSLKKKCEELIITRGNHDNFLSNVINKEKIKLVDYYIFKDICFLHGDRDFADINDKKIKYWIMGHVHPCITLQDDNKSEKYKCFLEGKFKDKNIIILPSFCDKGGIDIREREARYPWKLKINEFNVKIISDEDEIFDFGKLKKIN